jgi:hypothetical protein
MSSVKITESSDHSITSSSIFAGASVTSVAHPAALPRVFSTRLSSNNVFSRLFFSRRYKMTGLLIALISVGAISSLATHSAFQKASKAVEIIMLSTKPSIVYALHAKSDLALMNSEVVNEALTSNGTSLGTSNVFNENIHNLERDIIDASQNINFGNNGRTPILEMLHSGIAEYENQIGVIRGRSQSLSRDELRTQLSAVSLSLRNHASKAAENLEQLNLIPLEMEYASFKTHSGTITFEVFATLGIMLAVLLFIQFYLFRHGGHRIINLPLALSTVIIGISTAVAPIEVWRAADMLYSAKVEAFDNMLVLAKAQANVAEVNADKSMWLLLPNGTERDTSMQRLNTETLDVLRGDDPAQMRIAERFTEIAKYALDLERQGKTDEAKQDTPMLDGILGRAINHIYYGVEEREPITNAISAFLAYQKAISNMMALEKAGDHTGAVALTTGTAEIYFNEFQTSISKAISVENSKFEVNVSSAQNMLEWIPSFLFGGILLSVISGCCGILLRLRDYPRR